jgi:hypothetical protein
MATIAVEHERGDVYRVRVDEGDSTSEHQVTATADHVRRYAEGSAAETLIEASFRFLLEREPKESILGSFELPVIERYFPEYPRKIRSLL